MKKKNTNTISQNIKKYRLLNNMTQETLAGLLDPDTQYYAQLERGERNSIIRVFSTPAHFLPSLSFCDILKSRNNRQKTRKVLIL